MNEHQAEHLFHGPIAEEYDQLKLICPSAAAMSIRVGAFVANYPAAPDGARLKLLEVGCGTGITTTQLFGARADTDIVSVDNAPAMLAQARQGLSHALASGRLQLVQSDALSHLQAVASASIDIVASAYTLHNFLNGYRLRVLGEIYRVLKPGGLFVNGDRYALDDPGQHLLLTQHELRGYFRVFLGMNRPDLLEEWVVHLFSDESEEHIMRLQAALAAMDQTGFGEVAIHFREGVNTLLTGHKPCQ
jgi:ubiquinone/menaquinone biosynthesis C-methylase UbiE